MTAMVLKTDPLRALARFSRHLKRQTCRPLPRTLTAYHVSFGRSEHSRRSKDCCLTVRRHIAATGHANTFIKNSPLSEPMHPLLTSRVRSSVSMFRALAPQLTSQPHAFRYCASEAGRTAGLSCPEKTRPSAAADLTEDLLTNALGRHLLHDKNDPGQMRDAVSRCKQVLSPQSAVTSTCPAKC